MTRTPIESLNETPLYVPIIKGVDLVTNKWYLATGYDLRDTDYGRKVMLYLSDPSFEGGKRGLILAASYAKEQKRTLIANAFADSTKKFYVCVTEIKTSPGSNIRSATYNFKSE